MASRPTNSLSDTTLWMAAYQWQMLTRFAGELSSLFPSANAATEAGRYLRYHHGFEADEWAQVEAFARDNRDKLEGAEIDDRTGRFAAPGYDDGTGYDASGVGQQFRLLFGFAAQFTIDAGEVAEEHLRKQHRLGQAEWDAVEAFLANQEYYRNDDSDDNDGDSNGGKLSL